MWFSLTFPVCSKLFPGWKMPSHFSRFSRFSGPSGNPAEVQNKDQGRWSGFSTQTSNFSLANPDWPPRSRGGGECLPQCMLGYTPPAGTPPCRYPPREGTPPWVVTPPRPHDGHCSGRYASYWNAFLFLWKCSRSRCSMYISPRVH